jgi:hypothetical protein
MDTNHVATQYTITQKPHQTNKPSNHQTIKPSNHQTIKPSNHQTIKPSNQLKVNIVG